MGVAAAAEAYVADYMRTMQHQLPPLPPYAAPHPYDSLPPPPPPPRYYDGLPLPPDYSAAASALEKRVTKEVLMNSYGEQLAGIVDIVIIDPLVIITIDIGTVDKKFGYFLHHLFFHFFIHTYCKGFQDIVTFIILQ